MLESTAVNKYTPTIQSYLDVLGYFGQSRLQVSAHATLHFREFLCQGRDLALRAVVCLAPGFAGEIDHLGCRILSEVSFESEVGA